MLTRCTVRSLAIEMLSGSSPPTTAERQMGWGGRGAREESGAVQSYLWDCVAADKQVCVCVCVCVCGGWRVRDMKAMLQLLSCGHSSIRDRAVRQEGVRISDEGKGGWDKGVCNPAAYHWLWGHNVQVDDLFSLACKKGTPDRCKKG
jgi:hypothetical protein